MALGAGAVLAMVTDRILPAVGCAKPSTGLALALLVGLAWTGPR